VRRRERAGFAATDDAVGVAGDDQERRAHVRDPVDGGVAIAQEQAHRQYRVVVAETFVRSPTNEAPLAYSTACRQLDASQLAG
jgi:hypothetical protein